MIFDCSLPPPEPVTHHIARAVHNAFHPHHKRLYVPPKPQSCSIEYTMPEVVIEASPLADDPADNLACLCSLTGMPSDPFIGGGGYAQPPRSDTPQLTPQPRYGRPVRVPEPDGLSLFVMGLFALAAVSGAKRFAQSQK